MVIEKRYQQGSAKLARFFVVRVLRHDGKFCAFIVGICAIAATVACFQFAVFVSFLRAGAAVPNAIGGDVWIVARGVQCFDFPEPINEDYDAVISRFLPGARITRVAFGFSPWRSPIGRRSNVAVVGVERAAIPPTGFVADSSDLARLDLYSTGDRASIGNVTLSLTQTVTTLRTFLGAPYVLADFTTARALLGISGVTTSYLVVTLPAGLPKDFPARRAEADRAFPEVEMLTRGEFASRSSRYWQAKTGAGAAILLAAVLALLLMMVLLVNGIGRFVQRYDQDLLSLIGHGADGGELLAILFGVAVTIAVTSFLGALLAGPLLALAVRPILPWVDFRLADMGPPALGAIAGLAGAVLAARSALAAYSPEAVFRS